MPPEREIVAKPAAGHVLYRLVRDASGRVEDFRSHRDRTPRRPVPAGTPWLLLVGVSMFDSPAGALAVARRRPAWIAEVRLRAGLGIHVASTGPPGHHTVWADPRALASCIDSWREAP